MKRTLLVLSSLLILAAPAAQAQFNYTTNNGAITITGYTGGGGALIIPNTIHGLPVISIGNGAFANKANLTSVEIGTNVASIGRDAFLQCSGLTGVTIPNSVTSIGESAFSSCFKLASLALPYSVTNIGAGAFSTCLGLSGISVDPGNPAYLSVGGVVFNHGQTALVAYPAGAAATSYAIPASVTTIGGAAFENCYHLTDVTIPGSVKNIEDGAFVGCNGLTNVTLPDGVTTLGIYAFFNCLSLTNFAISASVTSIGDEALTACGSLAAIVVDPANPAYSSVDGVLFDKGQFTLVAFPGGLVGNYTIPGGVARIGAYAFEYCSLTGVTIPGGVASIGDYAFEYGNLAGVVIPGSVTNLGTAAFFDCINLTNATMADGITSIGGSAFGACSGLTSVIIPGTVASIADYAFQTGSTVIGAYFEGNAPSANSAIFDSGGAATVYYLPGATGWGSHFGGAPAMPLTAIGITANPMAGLAPLPVNFTSATLDSSNNPVVNSTWHYGDDSTGGGQNPTHTYTTKGTFAAALVETNTGGVPIAGSVASITVSLAPVFSGLVLNGGFETGDFTGWTLTGNTNNTLVDDGSQSGITPYAGNYGAALNTSGSLGHLSQVLSTTAGITYLLTLSLENPYADPGEFVVSWNGSTIFDTANLDAINSTNLQFVVLATGTSTVLRLGFEDDYDYLGLDGVTVAVDLQPFVAANPVSQMIYAGGSVTFGVIAGGNGPFTYAWYRDGASIAAATTSSYTTNHVQVADSGSRFVCVISNGYSSVTSGVAVLTVVAPPAITSQPTNITLVNGGTASFGVAVSGTPPFGYQWQFDGTNIAGSNIINTVAGGYLGYGGAATNATLYVPEGVAVDASGNLFIADFGNDLILKVDTNGIITIVAGGGADYYGDGGPATNGTLSRPAGVAVDASGNLFIADAGDDLIRKVDSNGIITTVAGNGRLGYSGDGGPAVSASLSGPVAVAVDGAGNLFFADSGSNVIRKVDIHGIITTVAGNGHYGYAGDGGPATAASLYYPDGLVVDGAGNILIADSNNNRVRKVGPDGIITTVAGNGNTVGSGAGGFATNSSLDYPAGLAVDASGSLFIAERDGIVHRVGTNGIITTVAGDGGAGFSGDGGPATNASLFVPLGVAVDALGNLFIADQGNNRIRSVDTNGIIKTVAGGYLGDGSAATNASLFNPAAVAVDTFGDLFIVDQANNRVRRVGLDGIITTVAGNGIPGYSGDGGPAIKASLYNASGVAVDGAGNLFIADSGYSFIRKVDANGIITTVAGNGNAAFSGDGGPATNASLYGPAWVAVDTSGNLFIADSDNCRVRRVDLNGIITTVAGGGTNYPGDGGAATNASLNTPSAVAVDASGNLFIADTYDYLIRRVDTNGIITTAAGNGVYGYSGDGGPATNASLGYPAGVAVSLSGNLFIADPADSLIRMVDANGIITTVSGNLTQGFSGDGGPAADATLGSPAGLAVDVSGNLFLADTLNNRVREVTSEPELTLATTSWSDAGTYDVVVTSPYGSVTSQVVTLTVALPEVRTRFDAGTNIQFQFGGAAGSNYVLQYATNLTPPVTWLPFFTNAADADGNWSFTDTNVPAFRAGFFRIAAP